MNKMLKGIAVFACAFVLAACGGSFTDEQYVEKAQNYMDQGDMKSASIELKNALRENPDNMQARWLLGKLHLELGNAPAAEKELNRARELGVADELVLPLLAQALLEQGKTAKVQEISKEGLPGEQQAKVAAQQGLGKLAEGNTEDAAALIDEALQKDPNSAEARAAKARLLATKKEWEKAREELDVIFENDPEYAPAWSLLGDIEQQERNFERALEAYTKAVNFRVNDLRDRLKRALILIELQRYEEAQKDIDVLMKQSPLHPGVNFAQGMVHFQNKKLQDAQASFDLALNDKERYPQALFFNSLTNFLLGNIEQARTYAEEFFARFRNSIPVRKLLATIDLTEGKYAEAENLVRPITAEMEDDAVALNILANALLGQGNTDEAIELLSKVAVLHPESATAQVRLGAGLLLAGEQDSGVEHIATAIQLDPKFQQADILLVFNHLQRKEYEQALKAAESYRDRNPDSSAPYNLIGRVYLAQEQEQAAENAFEKARSITPGDPSANHALASLAIKNNDFPKARNYYKNVLDKHDNYLPTLLSLAVLDEQEGKEQSMVETLQKASAAHPNAVQPRLLLARHYLVKGKPEQVQPLFVDLSDMQKGSPSVLGVIGLSQLALRSFSDAKFTLEKLVQKQPGSAEAHSLLARAYAGLENRERTKEELEKAVELNPKHFTARLALTRVQIQEGAIKQAGENLKVLKELAPDQPDIVALEITIERKKGNAQQALSVAQSYYDRSQTTASMLMLAAQLTDNGNKASAIKIQKDWLVAHQDDMAARLALANMYTRENMVDESITEYRVILKQDQKNLIALNNLAWFLQDKNPQEALEYAKRADEIQPESPEIMDTLAMVMLKNDQARQAQRVMDKVIKLAPENLSMKFHSAKVDIAAGDRSTAEVKLTEIMGAGKEFSEKEEAKRLLEQLQSGGR